jgi:hypothetical protein
MDEDFYLYFHFLSLLSGSYNIFSKQPEATSAHSLQMSRIAALLQAEFVCSGSGFTELRNRSLSRVEPLSSEHQVRRPNGMGVRDEDVDF